MEPTNTTPNTPFTRNQIAEWKKENKGKRAFLAQSGPNRSARRATPSAKAVTNNRSNPKQRRKVYLKMARFHLAIQARLGHF